MDGAVIADSPRFADLVVAWLIFLALGYIPALAPARSVNAVTMTVFWGFFAMTLIVLCDQILLRLDGWSLLQQLTAHGRGWASLLMVGAVSGLLLDGTAQWLGKLWIYPYWNNAFYGATFVIGFAAYWIAIVESYLAVRSLLKRYFLRPSKRMAFASERATLFRTLGYAGAALTCIGIAVLSHNYRRTGYRFDIRTVFPLHSPLTGLLATFAGFWLILERVQYGRRYDSLLGCLMDGDRTPLYALLLASAIFGFLWETVNSAHHFWRYTNWPMPQVHFAGAPAAVFVAWPFQFVVFLSLGFIVQRRLWR